MRGGRGRSYWEGGGAGVGLEGGEDVEGGAGVSGVGGAEIGGGRVREVSVWCFGWG